MDQSLGWLGFQLPKSIIGGRKMMRNQNPLTGDLPLSSRFFFPKSKTSFTTKN